MNAERIAELRNKYPTSGHGVIEDQVFECLDAIENLTAQNAAFRDELCRLQGCTCELDVEIIRQVLQNNQASL